MKRVLPLAVMLSWFLILVACNFPGLKDHPDALSAEELRQTLAARVSATAQLPVFIPLGTWTPGSPAWGGLSTATPPGPQPSPQSGEPTGSAVVVEYYSQSGDTLQGLAGRFGVAPGEIISMQPIPAEAFISPGQLLYIPNIIGPTRYPSAVMPDSEVLYSPSVVEFDIEAFVAGAGGYLVTYGETINGEWLSGADIIERLAVEASTNPRLLLALLEFRSHWVLGQPANMEDISYPIGFHASGQRGLYRELLMVTTHLQIGYYGWRVGSITDMRFRDGSQTRLSPGLNAGSIAVQNLFAKLYEPAAWQEAMYGEDSFPSLYQRMFGDPWARAASVEPLFPPGLEQPTMELPFAPGGRWSLTGGPHPSWKTGSPPGAIDLAPVTGERSCVVSRAWVTASAPGLVVRSERNVVAIDLDGDGSEGTGWVVFYFHIADHERISAGVWLNTDDPIGHPSCEGGRSTGTHVHIARKFNGEWIAADGPLPMILSGWEVSAGEKNYLGQMRRGDQLAVASPVGPRSSIVTR